MGTQDISRNVFDSSKHYSSVRQQQGRVLTDDDWNENNRIHEKRHQQSIVDIVGSAASPNDGFLISAPTSSSSGVNFTINAGHFYLGGQQLCLEEDQTYGLQTDWLQGPTSIHSSKMERVDLVVLESYQQVVTAVEDTELYEVALGGADTTTRLRTLQRVHLIQDVGSDECGTAWARYVRNLSTTGSLESDNSLVSDARMSADFVVSGSNGDLCKPSVTGGYLGAENQTIRVQLRDDNTFTWGFDNAAPLYRVQLDATRTRVILDTPPRDQYHWPQAEQTVEILAWASLLGNKEKIAEHEGFLTRLAAGYNPATGEITLAEPVPTAGFNTWQGRSDRNKVANGDSHLYMRVWNRGSDRDSPSAVPCNVGNPVDLGFTGIQVTFGGTQLNSGDYWLITARPSAPNEVVPWSLELLSGKSPFGPTKYYAPLALINWSSNLGAVVTDCRGRFKPLSKQKCCIELVAQPGPGWHHIFDQIPNNGDAVICLPAGDYPVKNSVTVQNKGRLRLIGAGKSSRIIGTGNDVSLRFGESNRVEISHVYISSGNQHGPGIKGALSFDNVNHVDVRNTYIRTRAGRSRDIACLRVDNRFSGGKDQGRVKICDCEFYVGHLQIGILVVNAAYIDITRNLLLPSGPDVESVQKSLQNIFFRHDVVNTSLTPRFYKRRTIPKSRRVSIDLSDQSTLEFLTDEVLKPYWQEEIQSINLGNFETEDQGKIRQLLLDRLRRTLESKTRFEGEENVLNWLSVINGDASAFINQGIVVGGRRAVNVNVSNNEIKGATQGIHIGLSHSTRNRKRAEADVANSITVENNYILTTIGAGSRAERHGCFVGNAQKIQVLNNVFHIKRLYGMRHIEVEAIRVFGFYGPMLRVIGNCADIDFDETVRIELRGSADPDWVIVERENYPAKEKE